MSHPAPSLDGLTARIADHVAAVANAPLTAADIEALRRLLLDNAIVSLWGTTRPVVQTLAEWSRRFAGTGPCIIAGADWTTEASVAALVHGTAGHAYELDDTHDVTASHPGCVLIAATLAEGTVLGSDQTAVLRALAAGYEAMALIGATSGGLETVHRGFHPTPVFGAFGAATACLTLQAIASGQPVIPEALTTAWGLALSMPNGSMQFSVEGTGGEIKRVHAGLGARNGIVAAQFAALPAISAPRQVLEGTYGVAASFGGPLRDVTPGETLQIHTISLKPYSCCRLFHSTIDALREATDGFTLPLDQIVGIEISGPRLVAEQHMIPAESTMTAQYSCPYIVGATLAYGPERYDAYGEGFLNDPRIRSIAAKVTFCLDPEMEAQYYPRHYASGVRLMLADGTERRAMVVDSFGTARKPLSREQIIGKAGGLAAQGDFPAGEDLATVIWNDDSDARALARLLAAQDSGRPGSA